MVRTLESSLVPRGLWCPCLPRLLASPPFQLPETFPLNPLVWVLLLCGAQYRDILLSNVQSRPRDKNAAKVAVEVHTRELALSTRYQSGQGATRMSVSTGKGLERRAFQTGSDSSAGLGRLTGHCRGEAAIYARVFKHTAIHEGHQQPVCLGPGN